MIAKKTFIAAMKALQKQKTQEESIAKALEEMTGETHYFNVADNLEYALVNTLTEIFNDKYGWLAWWIYEKDFGREKLKAYDVNKKGIKLNTASQLYDFLIKEM